jgi:hypothetical protein
MGFIVYSFMQNYLFMNKNIHNFNSFSAQSGRFIIILSIFVINEKKLKRNQ